MTELVVDPLDAGPSGFSDRGHLDLPELKELAAFYIGIDDAAALMAVDRDWLTTRIESKETPESRAWREGRASARLKVRRAQFSLLEKNASMAVQLGREIFGQDVGAAEMPVMFVVDTGIHRDGDETNPDGV